MTGSPALTRRSVLAGLVAAPVVAAIPLPAAFASGGVMPGGWAFVGERGPEWIVIPAAIGRQP